MQLSIGGNRGKIAASVILLVFILIFLIQNYYFIKTDKFPQDCDSHYKYSLTYFDILSGVKTPASRFDIYYPPLVYLITAPFYRLQGATLESARLSLSVYSVIFFLAMFGIGFELGGIYAAFAVMALAVSSPFVLDLSRRYVLGFPNLALVSLAFYLLLKTNYFRHRIYSLLFGLVLAISVLVKWSTLYIMFVPTLWFIFPAVFPAVFRSRYSLTTMLILLLSLCYSSMGLYFYFKTLIFIYPDPNPFWHYAYLTFILVPALFILIIMSYLEVEWKKEPGEAYSKSGASRIINLAYMGAIFKVVSVPWFLTTASAVSYKYITDIVYNSKDYIATKMAIQFFYLIMFFLAPVLIAVGLFLAFKLSKNLYRMMVFPVTLVFLTWFIYKIGFPNIRYMVPLIIFSAPLAGYWFKYLGNFRLPAVILVMSIALYSMLMWTFVNPRDNICFGFVHDVVAPLEKSEIEEIFKQYYHGGLLKLPLSSKPINIEIELSPVLKEIDNNNFPVKFVFFYNATELPVTALRNEAREIGKRIKLIDCSARDLQYSSGKKKVASFIRDTKTGELKPKFLIKNPFDFAINLFTEASEHYDVRELIFATYRGQSVEEEINYVLNNLHSSSVKTIKTFLINKYVFTLISLKK
jgi:4-amino-4-deoxy-L-arabinose transferase-like glycosyltransferase